MEENKKVLDQEDEMIDVAKEANQLIAQKDKELKELKLKLAKSELYRTVEDDEVKETPYDFNKEFTPMNSDIDFAIHAVQIHRAEVANKNKIKSDDRTGEALFTLGPRAQDVHDFLTGCIEESKGDPIQFHKLYNSKLSSDSSEANQIYNQTKREIERNNDKYNIKNY